MIVGNKKTGLVIFDAFEKEKSFCGRVIRTKGYEDYLNHHIPKKEAIHLFSKEEIQQMIESAVDEDRKLMQEEMKRWKDCANRSAFENQKLIDKNNRLLYEIEELKAKVPQPIEISQDLADAIEHLRSLNFKDESIIFHSAYLETIECADLVTKEDYKTLDSCGVIRKEMWKPKNEDPINLFHALVHGYTVKPEPTLQNQIENILRALEYDFSGVEEAAKEIVIVLKHEGMLKDEEA